MSDLDDALESIKQYAEHRGEVIKIQPECLLFVHGLFVTDSTIEYYHDDLDPRGPFEQRLKEETK